MSSVQAILFQLTSGLVSETAVQTEYLYVPEIVAEIQQYNWSVMPSCVEGWPTLRRYGMYHD